MKSIESIVWKCTYAKPARLPRLKASRPGCRDFATFSRICPDFRPIFREILGKTMHFFPSFETPGWSSFFGSQKFLVENFTKYTRFFGFCLDLWSQNAWVVRPDFTKNWPDSARRTCASKNLAGLTCAYCVKWDINCISRLMLPQKC